MNSTLPPPERLSHRLRRFIGAIGRLLAQVGLFWFFSIPVLLIMAISPEDWGHNESYLILKEGLWLTLNLISIGLILKVVDDEDLDSLGLRRDKLAIRDFFAGFLLTLIVSGLGFLIYLELGMIRVEGFVWQTQTVSSVMWNILGTFIFFCFVGGNEELLSRGFHLQTIEKGLNKFWGVLLSSIIFAYGHRNNPGITWSGLIYVFFFGLALAFLYLKSGQLWLSIGLHAGWDFFVTVVFYGCPIEGLRIFHLMQISSSPDIALIFYPMNFLSLAACFILAFLYAKSRKVNGPVKPGYLAAVLK